MAWRLRHHDARRRHDSAPTLVEGEAALVHPRGVTVARTRARDRHEDLAALEQACLVDHALEQRALRLVYAALGEQSVRALHAHGTEHRPQEGLTHRPAIMHHLQRQVEPRQRVAPPG